MTKMLYQPVSVDSINDRYKIIRNSSDRASAMISFCYERYGDSFAEKSVLDIGSCYGYFLNEFSKHCANIQGIENGTNQNKICHIFYPTVASKVADEDFTLTIDSYPQFDIVFLLSTMHTIIMSDGLDYATSILEKVDAKTKDVLFFDMGEEHEELYSDVLMGWNPESIIDWVLSSTTFDSYALLMQDEDEGVGRTLFAFYRSISQ